MHTPEIKVVRHSVKAITKFCEGLLISHKNDKLKHSRPIEAELAAVSTEDAMF